jgi:hypothetical protein
MSGTEFCFKAFCGLLHSDYPVAVELRRFWLTMVGLYEFGQKINTSRTRSTYVGDRC